MTDKVGVCVVAQPIGETGDSAPRTLLDILASITSVTLVAASIPDDAPVRKDHEVVEINARVSGGSIIHEAFGFLLTQIQMCHSISRRDEGVILFFGTTSYMLPILWARLIGRTVIMEPRGDVPRRLRIQWEQRLPSYLPRILAGGISVLEQIGYRLAHGIVTYTPSMAWDLGLKRYEYKLYPNGARYVDIDRFDVQIPFEERDVTVGYVGRFEEGKGVRALADAIPQLPENVSFRFIGDGPLADELAETLSDDIRCGRVELTGWVDHYDVPAELNRLQLLVLPSESEGLPTIVLEALACGTPVYATPVAGVPDVIKESETGFLMNEINVEVIVEDIERILKDESMAVISKNGRRLIEEEYSYEAAVERYRIILSDVTKTSIASHS